MVSSSAAQRLRRSRRPSSRTSRSDFHIRVTHGRTVRYDQERVPFPQARARHRPARHSHGRRREPRDDRLQNGQGHRRRIRRGRNGRTHAAYGRVVVLCASAIESVRILLNSRSARHPRAWAIPRVTSVGTSAITSPTRRPEACPRRTPSRAPRRTGSTSPQPVCTYPASANRSRRTSRRLRNPDRHRSRQANLGHVRAR